MIRSSADRRRAPDQGDLLRAALRAFDDAIAASPGNASLKAHRAELVKLVGDSGSARARLAEVEALMREPGISTERAKDLLRRYDCLLAEINEARR